MRHGLPRRLLAILSAMLWLPTFVSGAEHITLEVRASPEIPSDATLYFASNVNAWNPGYPAHQLKFVSGDKSHTLWRLELSRTDAERFGDSIEYKITMGGWERVEVTAEGGDVANRRIGAVNWASPEILVTADVLGFRAGQVEAPPPSVTGQLQLHAFHSATLGNQRTVRVWLPPGYFDKTKKLQRYSVLYMHDGQNVFDQATASFGVEWGADETATSLIKEGVIEPLIIVGIDNAGGERTLEYNPSALESQGRAAYGDKYITMLTAELMPFVDALYRTKSGPEHTGIGGSSYGGNITLLAIMTRPDTFGRAIIESPAPWVADDALFKIAEAHDDWPERIFLAVGDDEIAGGGTPPEVWVREMRRLEKLLQGKGLDEDRLMTMVVKDAKHNEAAWAERLPAAMRFLFGEGTARQSGED